MYIINEHGILHGIPDEWALPAKCRKATPHEVGVFLTTGQQNVALMPVAQGDPQPPAKPTRKGKARR